RERGRRVEDLRRSLRERAVYIDLHPILVADTRQVYGYEALARGTLRTLRRPASMFAVGARSGARPTCERPLYIDLPPILVADTRQVHGYEALAGGTLRTLRSPEIMFDVAA